MDFHHLKCFVEVADPRVLVKRQETYTSHNPRLAVQLKP